MRNYPLKQPGADARNETWRAAKANFLFDGVTSVCPHTPVPRYVPLATGQWQIVKRTVP